MKIRFVPLRQQIRRVQLILLGRPIPEDQGGEYRQNSILGYASLWRRMTATVLDVTFFGLIFLLCLSLISPSYVQEDLPLINSQTFLIILCTFWLYESLFTSSDLQATPGMYLCNCRLSDEAGCKLSFARASLRHIYQYATFFSLGIGFFTGATSAYRQALHDIMAETYIWQLSYKPLPKLLKFSFVDTSKPAPFLSEDY